MIPLDLSGLRLLVECLCALLALQQSRALLPLGCAPLGTRWSFLCLALSWPYSRLVLLWCYRSLWIWIDKHLV